jgi:hypothetical protein
MSPTGTGEGSQVFYMMLGLNTVLVKQCRQVDYITGTDFSFEQPKHFKFNDIRTTKTSWATLGLSDQFADTQGFTQRLWVSAISRFYEWRRNK